MPCRNRLDRKSPVGDTSLTGTDNKGKDVQGSSLEVALVPFSRLTGLPVVRFSVDGSEMLGALEISPSEHERRRQTGVGAVTSTALLHGLWLLTPHGPTPSEMLPEIKVQRLRAAPHAAVETDEGFELAYSPPGMLRSVALRGRSVERAVARAARFTPIVERFVLVDETQQPVASPTERAAREWGVGIVSLRCGDSPEVLVPASPAKTGIPSVYRWWVAELAYERYLYESTHLVS